MTEKKAVETEPAATPEPVAEPVQPEPQDTHDVKWWEGRAKAMEADVKKANKRLAELEKKEQERAEAELSELQKATKRAEEAEAREKLARLAILRRDVAVRVGLTPALADRLQGASDEELEADAKLLLQSIPVPVAPKLQPTNPGQPQTGETDAERRKRLGL